MSKELVLLAQVHGAAQVKNTIKFMSLEEIQHISKYCTVTYTSIVYDFRIPKDDPNWVRIIVGGNLID